MSRLFGHGDEVTANGVARTVVRYIRDRSYRRREHECGTMYDLYACETSPAKESPFIISVNYEFG